MQKSLLSVLHSGVRDAGDDSFCGFINAASLFMPTDPLLQGEEALSRIAWSEKGNSWMAYVITSTCVADYSCLEACPVDCISPGPTEASFDTAEQLYIDPRRCIDCAACVEACPVLAIHEASQLPSEMSHYAEINAHYFVGSPA